jgi:AcrR family transcriptional regulator
MRQQGRKGTKGEATRQHVLDAALDLFRRRGFERTTMRDIAGAAGLSLGAAYHYFPSKEALVMAYYEWMQVEHERRAKAACPDGADLKARLLAIFHTKLELLRGDRKVLAALFRNLGDPSHSLSVFGRQTAAVRDRSIAQFEEAFEDPDMPKDLQKFLGRAVWLAHLGVFLVFIHDRSEGEVRTHKLIAALVDLVGWAAPLLRHRVAAPVRRRLMTLVAELGFAPGAAS